MRFSEDRIEKLTCSDGNLRSIHIWEPEHPRAIFLAIHGGLDIGGNFMNAGLYFKKQNITTVAQDQHGHDNQEKVYIPNFDVFLDDLELMITWVKGQYQNVPIFILSHSAGGLISTHFGIRRPKDDPRIKGFIMAAPYYVNSIGAPRIVVKLAGILSVITPRMALPLEDLSTQVTHDEKMYARHEQDKQDGIMATKASARFAHELMKAQQWVPENIAKWKHPLLAIIAGHDKIANTEAVRELLARINPGLITELLYPENYHENLNELNRDEIFGEIVSWVERRMI
jgi:lysophospholipase